MSQPCTRVDSSGTAALPLSQVRTAEGGKRAFLVDSNGEAKMEHLACFAGGMFMLGSVCRCARTHARTRSPTHPPTHARARTQVYANDSSTSEFKDHDYARRLAETASGLAETCVQVRATGRRGGAVPCSTDALGS